MKSQAVLLSPRAQMNAKPELEIFADDVVCGHGATVASIDPEQVFYLQARGLAKGEAEALLLEAFGAETIDKIRNDAAGEPVASPSRGLAREAGPRRRRRARRSAHERRGPRVRGTL